MFNGLFPRQIDATYRGHNVAPWLLIVIVSVKIAQSLAVFFGGQYVVSSAEAIDLDLYPLAAAQTIVFAFVVGKVDRLLISLLCLLVLDRYRALIPLMFTVFLLQETGRTLAALFYPIATLGTPPAIFVNVVLFGLGIIGLPLSLWRRSSRS